jgi:hypothetical protein
VLTVAKTPGPYTVSPSDEGGPITNGSYPGIIQVGDLDPWTFQATANDRITLSLGEVMGGGSDPVFWPWLRLRGPDGAPLGDNSGFNAAQLDVRVPLTGTYTVLVAGIDAGCGPPRCVQVGTGSYVLALAGATSRGAVPSAPTLTGSVSGNNVSVAWTPSLSGGAPSSYIIEAGTAPGATNFFNGNVGNLTSATAVLGPATYYIRVRGVNATGTGPPSSPDLILTLGCSSPLTPTGLTHSKSGNNVTVSWNPSVGATSYVLQAGVSPGLSNAFNSNVGPGTSLNATAVLGTYFVRVIAVGACGFSPPTSPDMTVTVP